MAGRGDGRQSRGVSLMGFQGCYPTPRAGGSGGILGIPKRRLLSLQPRGEHFTCLQETHPGLDKLPAFYLAAAEITQLCSGRNNLRRPSSSIPASFLVVPRSLPFPLARHSHPSQGCGQGEELPCFGWDGFFPTGRPFMQEVSQGLRIKCIYSIKQINSCPKLLLGVRSFS